MMRLLAPLLLLVAAAPAVADNRLDAAIDAYDRHDWARARALVRPAVAQGSAIAETLMGMIYLDGQPRRPAVAAGFLLRAAERGYAPAQIKLGDLLAAGTGLRRDPAAAYRWYRIVAIRADVYSAAIAAARAYRIARGLPAKVVEEQDQQAHDWRVRAASGR